MTRIMYHRFLVEGDCQALWAFRTFNHALNPRIGFHDIPSSCAIGTAIDLIIKGMSNEHTTLAIEHTAIRPKDTFPLRHYSSNLGSNHTNTM